jgi:hypothetical protein
MYSLHTQVLYEEASKHDGTTLLAISIISAWRQMLQSSSLVSKDAPPGSSIHSISPSEAEHLLKSVHSTCTKAHSCGTEAFVACCTELRHLAAWVEDHIAGMEAFPGWTMSAQVSCNPK